MRGKILFFSEEKGFGKIIDSKKNDYFFYINKIKNKPELINKDDEVEFEYYESPKGLRAENIFFIVKIKCPVCGYINLESEKNCKNEKCKFELTYVKDGAFIGLSSTDIEKYNQKLNKKKEIYKSNIIENKNSEKVLNPEKCKFNKVVLKNITHNQNLKDLKRTQFENEIEYKNRIDGLDYFLIGKVKLENYVRDDEYFNINCKISENYIGSIRYAFDYETKVYIPVLVAKDFFSNSINYNLSGKISIIEGEITLVDICVSTLEYSPRYNYSFKKCLSKGILLEIEEIITDKNFIIGHKSYLIQQKEKEITEYEHQKSNINRSETSFFIFKEYNKYEQNQVNDFNQKIKKLENEIISLKNEIISLKNEIIDLKKRQIEEKTKLNL